MDEIKQFILLHHKQYPEKTESSVIQALLTHLAVKQHVAASTPQQALSVLFFLYRKELRQE